MPAAGKVTPGPYKVVGKVTPGPYTSRHRARAAVNHGPPTGAFKAREEEARVPAGSGPGV